MKIRKEIMNMAKEFEGKLREQEKWCKENKFTIPFVERVEVGYSYDQPKELKNCWVMNAKMEKEYSALHYSSVWSFKLGGENNE